MIPASTIQRIRDATDIVSLVSQYVALRKSGARWMGCCPFHEEKTASFVVFPGGERPHYTCFGCSARAMSSSLSCGRRESHSPRR